MSEQKAYVHTPLGKFILHMRVKKKINMYQMAKALDISTAALSSLEVGRTNIDREMYLKIKKYFKLRGLDLRDFNQSIYDTKKEEADEIITGKFKAITVDELPF